VNYLEISNRYHGFHHSSLNDKMPVLCVTSVPGIKTIYFVIYCLRVPGPDQRRSIQAIFMMVGRRKGASINVSWDVCRASANVHNLWRSCPYPRVHTCCITIAGVLPVSHQAVLPCPEQGEEVEPGIIFSEEMSLQTTTANSIANSRP
jgi:hypothetical protein